MEIKVDVITPQKDNPLYLKLGTARLFYPGMEKINNEWYSIPTNKPPHFEKGTARIESGNSILIKKAKGIEISNALFPNIIDTKLIATSSTIELKFDYLFGEVNENDTKKTNSILIKKGTIMMLRLDIRDMNMVSDNTKEISLLKKDTLYNSRYLSTIGVQFSPDQPYDLGKHHLEHGNPNFNLACIL